MQQKTCLAPRDHIGGDRFEAAYDAAGRLSLDEAPTAALAAPRTGAPVPADSEALAGIDTGQCEWWPISTT